MVREAARVNADNKLSVGILRMDSDGSFNLGFYSSEATGATTNYGPGDAMVFDLTRPLKAAQAAAADTLLVHLLIVTPNGGGNISVRSLQAAMLDDVPSVLYTVPAYPAPGSVMLLR